MTDELGKVTTLVKELETNREKQYGALGEQLTTLSQTSAPDSTCACRQPLAWAVG